MSNLEKLDKKLEELGVKDDIKDTKKNVSVLFDTANLEEKQVQQITELLRLNKKTKKQSEALDELIEKVGEIKLVLPEKQLVKVENQLDPDDIRADEVSVKNLGEIEIPEKFDIKKPKWWKQVSESKIVGPIVKQLERILKVKIVNSGDPKNPVSVRLSDGKKFYKAVSRAIASGGGSIPFKTSTGQVREALVDSDGKLQIGGVTLNTSDIEIGAVEIKNATDDTRATVGSLGLHVDTQSFSNVYNGQNTVASAGTAEVLASSQTVRSVTVKALSTNSNNIYVGDSAVTSSNGLELLPGESVSLDVNNVNTIYIDADTNGEGVGWVAIG